MWVVEGAANALADEITEQEGKVVQHTFFKRVEEVGASQYRLERLTEDFRSLWALQTLLRERSFQRSATDFAAWLKAEKQRKQ